MEIQKKKVEAGGIKFFIEKEGREIARAYLYIMKNDLHENPFGLMEDVYVDEAYRGGICFARLIDNVIEEAGQRCYKLIATSRDERKKVHELYRRKGFRQHGLEFRMDF